MANSLLNKIIETNDSISSLPVRLTAGTIFAAHGAQKLFGWFGGYGLEATGQWMASIGLEPGFAMALLAGGAEFFGGIALILGVLTRPAAFVLAITMIVAILSVHIGNGFFMSGNGYEFGLILLGASAGLFFSGAGRFSVDRWISQQHFSGQL